MLVIKIVSMCKLLYIKIFIKLVCYLLKYFSSQGIVFGIFKITLFRNLMLRFG